MSVNARKWLLQGGSFLLAGLLLYLALRGVDFRSVGGDLAGGHYLWIFPLLAVTILSHIIRAWRWRLFLHALPERGNNGRPVSIRLAFSSLMIGYMANYAAPRLGEIVRSGNLAVRAKLRFGGVLGTVVVERTLDVVMLGLGLLTVPLVLGSRTGVLGPLLVEPVKETLAAVPLWLGIGSLVLTTVLVYAVVAYWRKHHRARPESRLKQLLDAFRDGFVSLTRTGRPASIIASTIAMWMCYVMMAFLPLVIFGMTDEFNLGVFDAWGLMLLGSIGVVVPSPGGIGSYHYITIQALVLLYGVPAAAAASYAIFTHAGQLILYVAIGFAAMMFEGASWSELLMAGSTTEEHVSPPLANSRHARPGVEGPAQDEYDPDCDESP